MDADTSTTRPFPDEVAAVFVDHLDGLSRGEIVVRRCAGCAGTQWPPRPLCGACGGSEFEPRQVEPSGAVHTWTVVRRAFHPWFAERVPYGVAVVELEPGLRITGLYDAAADLDALRCDLPVRGSVERLGGSPGIVWSPATAPGGGLR